jgi:hypothetical protein
VPFRIQERDAVAARLHKKWEQKQQGANCPVVHYGIKDHQSISKYIIVMSEAVKHPIVMELKGILEEKRFFVESSVFDI